MSDPVARSASEPVARLRAAFREHYEGADPTHLVESPGRVNLIGEHTDYNGLPVLPMAIQRRMTLVFRPREHPIVRIATSQSGFEPRRFEISEEIEPYPSGDWGNYAKAAALTLARQAGVSRGIDAMLESDIPVAAGLSSSSALVVASALALLEANDLAFGRTELAGWLAAGERYVGTRGGGMDQAICLSARAGHAGRIDFEPLRVELHPVPADWCFVVAHSLATAPKSGVARETYNRRTSECAEALAAVATHLGEDGRSASYPALLDRHEPNALYAVAEEVLDPVLRRRFHHVVSEARRVELAVEAMAHADLSVFGVVMDASHRSLRDDYEVSTLELDNLVRIAEEAGAAGARLTGAGMGGCMITLCPAEWEEGVKRALAERFYAGRRYLGGLEERLFTAQPSEGASVTAL
jgi:galactokinase